MRCQASTYWLFLLCVGRRIPGVLSGTQLSGHDIACSFHTDKLSAEPPSSSEANSILGVGCKEDANVPQPLSQSQVSSQALLFSQALQLLDSVSPFSAAATGGHSSAASISAAATLAAPHPGQQNSSHQPPGKTNKLCWKRRAGASGRK